MEKLLQASRDAMKNSYSPYSNFRVGAAALLKNGEIISGCNVENASYGLSNCAERTTIFMVYALGYTKEDIMAFAVSGATREPIAPCGACRQVLSELLLPNTPIYLTNLNNHVTETSIEELLPYRFSEVE